MRIPKEVSFETVTVDARGELVERLTSSAPVHTEDLGDGVSLDLMGIRGGTFTMGSPPNEIETEKYFIDVVDDAGRLTDGATDLNLTDESATPRHEVSLPYFWMGRFEVTQAQWHAVASFPTIARELDADPSQFKGPDLPVERVSWPDAVEFCARLSRNLSIGPRNLGPTYRLPSEAEWEYAARAGTDTPFHFGPTLTSDLANYSGEHPYGDAPKGERSEQTTDVGSFGVANAFGLYDMHGNVSEWVEDEWHESYEGAPTDGKVWKTGDSQLRVTRGGGWWSNATWCRSAHRHRTPGDDSGLHGFRVVSPDARMNVLFEETIEDMKAGMKKGRGIRR